MTRPSTEPPEAPSGDALESSGSLAAVLSNILDTLGTAAAARMGVAHASLMLAGPALEWLMSTAHGWGATCALEQAQYAVVADHGTTVVTDAHADPELADDTRITEQPVRFYAGAPVLARDGSLHGVLSVCDEQPRTPTPEDLAELEDQAALTAALLELRPDRASEFSGEAVLAAITRLLDLIVSGSAVTTVLETLVSTVETALPEVACSIMLLEGDRLHLGAASSLPPDFLRVFEGLQIGPSAASCGTAAYTGEPVMVADISTDPRWADLREAALAAGLRACWSIPIVDNTQRVLGTLALWYTQARAPDESDLRQMSRWVNLAEVAISRARDVDSVRDAAIHDPLTGLANRPEATRILQQLTNAIDTAGAVLFIAIDQFSFVNDSQDQAAGDEYLVEVARRLALCVLSDDFVARVGKDEFLLICPGIESTAQAEIVGDRVIEAMRGPVIIDGKSLSLSVSVGVAMLNPAGGPASSDLIADADLAMYEAKRTGRNCVALFTEELRSRATDRMSLEADLNDALTKGELSCVYQPIVDMRNGRIAGIEVLARWRSATRGDVSPLVFIAAAEDSGQIGAVGEFVLRTACAQMAAFREADPGWLAVVLSVNVSARQLAVPAFPSVVEQTLADSRLPVDRLWLEVTENTLVPKAGPAHDALIQLRHIGVQIAIDDFGTGFSSLAQLSDLPADALKIDRSFVSELVDTPKATGVVQAVLTLADTMDFTVTAEGIETDEQRQILLDLGCRFGQGYFWSRPLTGDQLIDATRKPQPGAGASGAPLLSLPPSV